MNHSRTRSVHDLEAEDLLIPHHITTHYIAFPCLRLRHGFHLDAQHVDIRPAYGARVNNSQARRLIPTRSLLSACPLCVSDSLSAPDGRQIYGTTGLTPANIFASY